MAIQRQTVTPYTARAARRRAEGLREFCQPHNGYRTGASGQAIAERRYEIARLEDSLVRRGFRVIDENPTPQERTQAVVDSKQAGERIGRLKTEIAQLEKDRARYQQELDAYRTQVATR